MTHLFRIVLTLVCLVTAVASASAQTPAPVDESAAAFTALPGLESGAVRVFSGEAAAGTSASPVAASGITGATTAVLTFDTEMNAQAAMTTIQTDAQGESIAASLIVGDVGDRTAAFTLEDAAGTITGVVIVSQTGTEVIVVLADGTGETTETLATDIAIAIAGTPAGSEEETVGAAGTSTGGAWDRLPTSETVGLPTVEDIAI